jgi:hypothetical protein
MSLEGNYGCLVSERGPTLRRTEVSSPQPPLTPPARPSFALNVLSREGSGLRSLRSVRFRNGCELLRAEVHRLD